MVSILSVCTTVYVSVCVCVGECVCVCLHGWGNHPGKSGHGLTNILTLYISFEHKHYMYISEQLKQCYSHVCGLTIKMLVPPALVCVCVCVCSFVYAVVCICMY